MTDEQDIVALLREGVPEIGLHSDNSTELFDIEEANERMAKAAARIEADAATIAALREALGRIAEHKPLFDYVMAPFGDSDWQPGSPYDRGRQDEALFLADIASQALRSDA